MRQVQEVLRLKHVCGHSGHQIAAMVGVSRYTVAEYLRRAAVVGITWPVPAALDDVALERKLFTPPFTSEVARPQPEWPRIHAELRKPGVTLLLLWEEYRAGQPDGYGYSRFCDLHADWRGRLSPTMRQTHPAGERMFVDYAGQTAELIDGATGEVRAAQVFVAVLGASNFTYAAARWTQSLPDWIGCDVGAFARFGGIAHQIVCDNLKVGVTAACRSEPGISRTYQNMASHYGTALLPARVRRPRDKAKVEVAVQKSSLRAIARRWLALDSEIREHDAHLETLTAAHPMICSEHMEWQRAQRPRCSCLSGTIPSASARKQPLPRCAAPVRSRRRVAKLTDIGSIVAATGKPMPHSNRVVIVRMRGHQPTLDYVRRIAEGKPKSEIIRCLKRYVAREIYGYLCCSRMSAPPPIRTA